MRIKVLIGLILALLAGCWIASGQTIIGRPMMPLQPAFPLPSGGIKHWWVASDLSSSPVSDWVDRISGYHITQTSGTLQPAWSTNGVTFDGSNDTMNITNVVSGGSAGSDAVLCVVTLNSVVNQMWLGEVYSAGKIYFGWNGSGVLYSGSGGTGGSGFTAPRTLDFFACKTTNSAPYYLFTNNVVNWFNTQAWNSNVNLDRLGSGNGNQYFNGTIKELIIWTNKTFIQSELDTIHAYVTNSYGITP